MRKCSEAEIRAMIRDELNSAAMYNPKNGSGLPQPFGLVPSDGIWTVKLDRGPSIEQMREKAEESKINEAGQDPTLEELLQESEERAAEEMEWVCCNSLAGHDYVPQRVFRANGKLILEFKGYSSRTMSQTA